MDPIAVAHNNILVDSFKSINEVNEVDGKTHMILDFTQLLGDETTVWPSSTADQKPIQFWKYEASTRSQQKLIVNVGMQGFNLSRVTALTTASSVKGSFTDSLDLNNNLPVPVFDVSGRSLQFQYKQTINTVSYSEYVTPNVGTLEQSTPPLSAAGTLKTTSTTVTGTLDAALPTFDTQVLEDIIAQLYAKVPKFVVCTESANDVATMAIAYSELTLLLNNPQFVSKSRNTTLGLLYAPDLTTADPYGHFVIAADGANTNTAIIANLVNRGSAIQEIWMLIIALVMGIELDLTQTFSTIIAKVDGTLTALHARDVDNTVLLTEFATFAELSNYLEMKKLASLDELNKRVLTFYVEELRKQVARFNEEANRISSNLLQQRYLDGSLLSTFSTLQTVVNNAGIKSIEVDLTGTASKIDAFYVDHTVAQPRKIITFVQVDETIRDPDVEQDFYVCADNLSLGIIKRSVNYLRSKRTTYTQDYLDETMNVCHGSNINISLKDSIDRNSNGSTPQQSVLYQLGSYCNDNFFNTVLQCVNYNSSGGAAAIANAQLTQTSTCLRPTQLTVTDLKNTKLYARIVKIVSADEQGFTDNVKDLINHTNGCVKSENQKLGQFNIYTIALSREKNTDWKLATLINVIGVDNKIITYPDTDIVNTYVTSSVYTGAITGLQLRSNIEHQIQTKTISQQSEAISSCSYNTIISKPFVQDQLCKYNMRFSDNNHFEAYTLGDAVTQVPIRGSVYHYELDNVGLEGTLRTVKLSRDGNKTLKVKMPQFIIASQTLISDVLSGGAPQKRLYLFDVTSENIWFSNVVVNEAAQFNYGCSSKCGGNLCGGSSCGSSICGVNLCPSRPCAGDPLILQAQVNLSLCNATQDSIAQLTIIPRPDFNVCDVKDGPFYYNPNQPLQVQQDKFLFDVYQLWGSTILQRQVVVQQDHDNIQKQMVYEILPQLDTIFDEREQLQDPYLWKKYLDDSNIPYLVVDDHLNIDHGKLLQNVDNIGGQTLEKTITGNLFNTTDQIFGSNGVLRTNTKGTFCTDQFVRLGYKNLNKKIVDSEAQSIEFTSRFNTKDGFIYKSFINGHEIVNCNKYGHTYLFRDDTRRGDSGGRMTYNYQPYRGSNGISMSQNQGYSSNGNIILKDDNLFLYVHELNYSKEEDQKVLSDLYDDSNYGKPIQIAFNCGGADEDDGAKTMTLEFTSIYELLLYFTNVQAHMITTAQSQVNAGNDPLIARLSSNTVWEVKIKINIQKYYATSDDILWSNGLSGEIAINDLGNQFADTFFGDINNNAIDRLATYDYEFFVKAMNACRNSWSKELKKHQNLVITQNQVTKYKRGDREHMFTLLYDARTNQILDVNDNRVKIEKGQCVVISFYDNDPIIGKYLKKMNFDNAQQLFNAAYLVQKLFVKGKITQVQQNIFSKRTAIAKTPYALFPPSQCISNKYCNRVKFVQHQRSEQAAHIQIHKLAKGSCVTILDSLGNLQLGLIAKLRIQYDKQSAVADSFQKILYDNKILTQCPDKEGVYFINQDVAIDKVFSNCKFQLSGIIPESKKNHNDIQVRINTNDVLYGKLGFIQPYMLQHITSIGARPKKDNGQCPAGVVCSDGQWDLYCPPDELAHEIDYQLCNFKFVTLGNQTVDVKHGHITLDVNVSHADILFSNGDSGELVYYTESTLNQEIQTIQCPYKLSFRRDVISQGQQSYIKSYAYQNKVKEVCENGKPRAVDPEIIVETKYYLVDDFVTSEDNVQALVSDIMQDLCPINCSCSGNNSCGGSCGSNPCDDTQYFDVNYLDDIKPVELKQTGGSACKPVKITVPGGTVLPSDTDLPVGKCAKPVGYVPCCNSCANGGSCRCDKPIGGGIIVPMPPQPLPDHCCPPQPQRPLQPGPIQQQNPPPCNPINQYGWVGSCGPCGQPQQQRPIYIKPQPVRRC